MTEKKSSWWTTLPGILTGIAAIITAFGGLLLILYTIEVIGPKQNGKTTDEKQKTEESSKEVGKEEEREPDVNDQERHIIEQINEIDNQIKRLQSEIDAMRPEEEENPDAKLGIEDRENGIRKYEEDRQVLQDELHKLQQKDNSKENP